MAHLVVVLQLLLLVPLALLLLLLECQKRVLPSILRDGPDHPVLPLLLLTPLLAPTLAPSAYGNH
jgi:hypothetical protein